MVFLSSCWPGLDWPWRGPNGVKHLMSGSCSARTSCSSSTVRAACWPRTCAQADCSAPSWQSSISSSAAAGAGWVWLLSPVRLSFNARSRSTMALSRRRSRSLTTRPFRSPGLTSDGRSTKECTPCKKASVKNYWSCLRMAKIWKNAASKWQKSLPKKTSWSSQLASARLPAQKYSSSMNKEEPRSYGTIKEK